MPQFCPVSDLADNDRIRFDTAPPANSATWRSAVLAKEAPTFAQS